MLIQVFIYTHTYIYVLDFVSVYNNIIFLYNINNYNILIMGLNHNILLFKIFFKNFYFLFYKLRCYKFLVVFIPPPLTSIIICSTYFNWTHLIGGYTCSRFETWVRSLESRWNSSTLRTKNTLVINCNEHKFKNKRSKTTGKQNVKKKKTPYWSPWEVVVLNLRFKYNNNHNNDNNIIMT